MKVLVVDVGGTFIKLHAGGRRKPVRVDSGPGLGPREMVRRVREAVRGWPHDAVALGYPGPVAHGRPLADPHNLGRGWVRFDYRRAFGCPVRIANDAVLQALGNDEGGRMLFLGLGTGLGTALVDEGHAIPLELAHLPYRDGATFEDFVGKRGLERLGRRRWQRHVHRVSELLRRAVVADRVVVGGGNLHHLSSLPAHARRGDEHAAFRGGARLWAR